MATVEILSIPAGSQFVQSTGYYDASNRYRSDASINDFFLLLVFSENVIGLTADDLSFSFTNSQASATLLSLEGQHSVYIAKIRPSVHSTVMTVTLAANAVDQGNAQTTKTIRLSDTFPDTDAATPTTTSLPTANYFGIAKTRDSIIVSYRDDKIAWITEDGTVEKEIPAPVNGKLSYFNNKLILMDFWRSNQPKLINLDENYSETILNINHTSPYCVPTHYGILGEVLSQRYIYLVDYTTGGFTRVNVHRKPSTGSYNCFGTSVQGNNIVFALEDMCEVWTLDDTPELTRVGAMNIQYKTPDSSFQSNEYAFRYVDIDIFSDTLWCVQRIGSPYTSKLHKIDITEYLPVQEETKFNIYPVFASPGDTIDLTAYSPRASRITFDVGFDKPSWLSINANNQLTISNTAAVFGTGTKTVQPCLVKLKAYNYLDSTETGSFSFYLVVMKAVAPEWTLKNNQSLTMKANSEVNLYDFLKKTGYPVHARPSITFKSGGAKPTGATLTDGVFAITSVGGAVEFTASHGTLTTDIRLNIHLVNPAMEIGPQVRWTVEIGGKDVTDDMVALPQLGASLDSVQFNVFKNAPTTLTLQNIGDRYTKGHAGNFFAQNALNAGGILNEITIFVESYENGSWGPKQVQFVGLILKNTRNLKDGTVNLLCSEITIQLQNDTVGKLADLPKWDVVRKQSDEVDYQGRYVPGGSLLPMEVRDGEVYVDRAKLPRVETQFPSEGVELPEQAYLTATSLLTANGFAAENPLVRFDGVLRDEALARYVSTLFRAKGILSEVTVRETEADGFPYLLNMGNPAYRVEPTRIQRVPTDWCYDSAGERVLILLSNREGHLQDWIVEWDLALDTTRLLHPLDPGVKAHRIACKDSNTFAILTSGASEQDGSRSPLSNPSKADSYAYDAEWDEADVRILLYQPSQSTPFRTLVDKTDTPKPQLSVQYYVGFENKWTVFDYEGLRPEYRGPFEWKGNYLYYRSVNGVGRVDTTGTTTALVSNGESAFALTSGTTRYMVGMDWESETQGFFGNVLRDFKITKQVGTQTPTSVFSETKVLGDYEDISPLFGSPMNCLEALEHDDVLYMLVQYRKREINTNSTSQNASPDIDVNQVTSQHNASLYITTSAGLYPTNTRLAPGDDIPLRINLNNENSLVTYNAAQVQVYGATVVTPPSHSNSYTMTLRPNSDEYHSPIVVEFGQGAFTHPTLGSTGTAFVFINFDQWLSTTKTAGLALHACNVTDANPTLKTLKTWDFVHKGGVNLTLHDNTVYFTESPACANRYKPVDPDVEGYSEAMGYNAVETRGSLFKVTGSTFATLDVERIGNLWWTDQPYTLSPTRMLSIGDDLHLFAGYAVPDEVLRYNSPASQHQNFLHLRYGRRIDYRLPSLSTEGQSTYSVLSGLAQKINGILRVDNNYGEITERVTPRATLVSALSATGTTVTLKNLQVLGTLPSTGYFLIGDEVIRYTGVSGLQLTGLVRGSLGTPIASYAAESEVLFVDRVLRTQIGEPYTSIVEASDLNRLYNAITSRETIETVQDSESIAQYGEQVYNLELGLDRHQQTWQRYIQLQYLSELKDLHDILNVHTAPDLNVTLNQIVPIFEDGRVLPMRVLSVVFQGKETVLKGRTVTV